MKKLRVCLAQIEVIPGNPQANTQKMLKVIEDAKKERADLIAFSEMCIPGYLLGDMWERTSFLNECEECSNKIMLATNGITVVFGNVVMDKNKKNEDGRVRKYNSCLVAEDGCMAPPIVKTLQPNYREFDDNRHFYDARKMLMDKYIQDPREPLSFAMDQYYEPIDMVMGGSTNNHDLLSIGYMLCEDGWDNDYSFSPVSNLALKSDLLVNISCSPYTQGKNSKRDRVFGGHAKEYKKPLIYVNNVGIQNNGKTVYSFDGGSCIYDLNGNQLNPYSPFEEGWKTVEVDLEEGFGNPYHADVDGISMTHKAIVYSVKKFTEQMGIERVVIGASGGIDSAVVAAIMAEVLEPKNLLLVNMPTKYNSNLTKNAARKLAENIGCNYTVTPIEDSVKLTYDQISPVNWEINTWKEEGELKLYPCGDDILSGFMLENVQARDRSSRVLAAWSAWFMGVFTCNANKSEMTVGYTTLYGDLGGFLAPISDLWKGQVYELAKYINVISGKEIIPESSIDVVPSAELSDKQDVTKGLGDPLIYPYHDKLFAAWVERWDRATPEDILCWYLNGTLEKEIGYNGSVKNLFKTDVAFINDLERWWNLYDGFSVAKRIQAPPVLSLSRRAYGFDHRECQHVPCYSNKYLESKVKLLRK